MYSRGLTTTIGTVAVPVGYRPGNSFRLLKTNDAFNVRALTPRQNRNWHTPQASRAVDPTFSIVRRSLGSSVTPLSSWLTSRGMKSWVGLRLAASSSARCSDSRNLTKQHSLPFRAFGWSFVYNKFVELLYTERDPHAGHVPQSGPPALTQATMQLSPCNLYCR